MVLGRWLLGKLQEEHMESKISKCMYCNKESDNYRFIIWISNFCVENMVLSTGGIYRIEPYNRSTVLYVKSYLLLSHTGKSELTKSLIRLVFSPVSIEHIVCKYSVKLLLKLAVLAVLLNSSPSLKYLTLHHCSCRIKSTCSYSLYYCSFSTYHWRSQWFCHG